MASRCCEHLLTILPPPFIKGLLQVGICKFLFRYFLQGIIVAVFSEEHA